MYITWNDVRSVSWSSSPFTGRATIVAKGGQRVHTRRIIQVCMSDSMEINCFATRALDWYTVYRFVDIQPENCHLIFWFLCLWPIFWLTIWFIYIKEHAIKLLSYSFQYVFMLKCFKNATKLSLVANSVENLNINFYCH